MTAIYYNGVILRDCETKSFEQIIEYDESGTDVLYSRFRIRVASTLAAYANPPHGSTIEAGGLAVTERAADMHARLSEARKDFWMVLQGSPSDDQVQLDPVTGDPTNVASRVLLIAAGNIAGTMSMNPEESEGTIARSTVVDCENGPSPQAVSVTQIFGGRALRVEFEIVVCRKLCSADFSDGLPNLDMGQSVEPDNRVLSNRWSIEESKDQNWVTTKVLQGTLRVAHASYWPHMMRYLCIPTLLRGYKRVRQAFVDDATNLVLKYRIEDRQFHAAPPPPAIDWSGNHMESSTENGTLQGAEVQVRLTGPPGVDKTQLIGAAGKLLVSRIQGLIPERNPETGEMINSSVILQNAAIMDVMHEPIIQLRAQVLYEGSEYKWLGLRVQKMGQSLENMIYDATNPEEQPFTIAGYHPRVWPAPRPYDSESPAGIFSCYLQNPCSVYHDIPSEVLPGIGRVSQESDTGPPSPGESGDPESVFYLSPHVLPADETDMVAEYPNDPAKNVYDFPYTLVELQNRYVTDHGWSQLPLAAPAAAGQPSAALVRLRSPVCHRVLTMTASRAGLPPVVPSLIDEQVDPNGIREVLASDEIELLAPTLNPAAQGRIYSVRIMRTYLLERAPTATEKLRSGASPLDRLGAAEHHYDLTMFADTAGHLQSVATEPEPEE